MQEIFVRARERLMAAGYRYIGMDHFAREDDDLTAALRDGTLRRNFMGYTTQAGTGVLGFGASAISEVRGAYWQNEKHPVRYAAAVAAGGLPAVRGMTLSPEDQRRRDWIRSLLCVGRADLGASADRDLAGELQELAEMEADGLVTVEGSRISVTEAGRLFQRTIASTFDTYARAARSLPPAQSLPAGPGIRPAATA
jgi:oxygen-independent coproporphyrinogen-3 oxidase